MFYDRGNRPGFHIFIISARSRNVKYILTENVPVKRFALSPGLFVIRACAARLHPKGTSSRFALRAPRRACALLAMTREEGTPKFVIARLRRSRGNLAAPAGTRESPRRIRKCAAGTGVPAALYSQLQKTKGRPLACPCALFCYSFA